MQLIVTGRHVNVTEPIKVYAGQKLIQIVKKHTPTRVTKAHIILDVQKYRQIVEMELHCPQTNIYGKATSRDMYTSIDKVVDKIERQLKKFKTKYDKRKHVRAPSIREFGMEED